MKAEYYAACSFGLEAAAAAELKKLGLDDVEAKGCPRFSRGRGRAGEGKYLSRIGRQNL